MHFFRKTILIKLISSSIYIYNFLRLEISYILYYLYNMLLHVYHC